MRSLSSNFVIRGIGLVSLIAFLSLSTQILGLVGGEGILPAERFFQVVSERFGSERFWIFPSLCWFSTTDSFLLFLCYGGAFLSVLLIAGIFPAVVLPLLWAFYLSLATVGGEFLGFQWDSLLLEATFVSIPLALAPTNRWALLLPRLLLFKLMISSGLVKLASGDPVWRDLTALTYHYWSQPLPNLLSWHVHQLPLWFHKFSCGFMFFVELIIPFAFFGTRRIRLFAFFVHVGFQILILLTGNYGFFNLMAIVLGIPLVSFPLRDPRTADVGGGNPTLDPRPQSLRVAGMTSSVCTIFFLILFLFVSAVQMSGIVVGRRNIPRWAVEAVSLIAPFRTINRYGLFAVMTKERREIAIEGSDDGINWEEYVFRWKPGDVSEAPKFLVGHMPRLDWQMWFAALGDIRRNPWMGVLMRRLVEGTKEVENLFATVPFRDKPPRFVRAVVYDYRFTDRQTKSEAGAWWSRNWVGIYSPIISRSGEVFPPEKGD